MRKAREEILSRKGFDGQIKSLLDRIGELLQRCVNYGTELIPLLDEAAKDTDEGVAILTLLRHTIEMLDGVEILVRRGAADPCFALLRSMMESIFSIEYIIEADSRNRGLAYQVQHAHDRIELYRRMDPSTSEGKEFVEMMKEDHTIGADAFTAIDSTELIANLQRMLARPEFVPVEAEWRKRAAKDKWPTWYSLSGGPRTIRKLAHHLKKQGWYEVLYKDFSRRAHAGGALDAIHPTKGGGKAYQPLRYPASSALVANLAISMAMHIYYKLLHHYCSGKVRPFVNWYMSEIRPDFQAILRTRFNDETLEKRPVPLRK
jgi:hypothetical protein